MPSIWIATGAGALGGLVGVPFIAATTFKAVPFVFVVLAIGLAWLQRRGTTATPRERVQLRSGWKGTAWLLLVGGFALPLLTVPGIPLTVFVIASALIGAFVDILGDRIVPA